MNKIEPVKIVLTVRDCFFAPRPKRPYPTGFMIASKP